MREPLISFVIPCRNEGPALAATLHHLERIAKPHAHEIVLVDDASDPPVSATLPPDLLRRTRIEPVARRGGVAKARATGSEAARGRILFHLDAHVCFGPGSIERMLAAHERFPGAILGASLCHTTDLELFESCAAGSWRADGLPRSHGWKVDLTPLPWIVPGDPAASELGPVPIVGAAALWIPSSTYRALDGFFPGLVGYGNVEDTELCLSAWALGFEVRLVRDAVCLHYGNPELQETKEAATPGHEHPYYDGNALNAARVARLHLPIDAFLSCGYRPEDISMIPSRDFTRRARRIEARRERTREEVLAIALNAQPAPIEPPAGSRALVSDSRSRISGLSLRDFSHVACCSHLLRDALAAEGHPAVSMLGRAPDGSTTLDSIHAYYRPVLWSRAFGEGEEEELDRLAAHGRLHLEDAALQHLSPYWYHEDYLGRFLSRTGVRSVSLALEDELLHVHLRRFLERHGKLYGVEIEPP